MKVRHRKPPKDLRRWRDTSVFRHEREVLAIELGEHWVRSNLRKREYRGMHRDWVPTFLERLARYHHYQMTQRKFYVKS